MMVYGFINIIRKAIGNESLHVLSLNNEKI